MEILGLLRDLGIFGIGAAALAFLLRGLFNHILSRDLDKFKMELQASHDKEIERFRADLRAVAFERETRFARLHERRAEVVAELYRRLVNVESAYTSLTEDAVYESGHPATSYPTQESQKATSEVTYDFFKYFTENRIYFDEALCKNIDELIEKLDAIWETRIHEFDYPKAWQITKDDIPPIRKKIEKRFREMLGVKG